MSDRAFWAPVVEQVLQDVVATTDLAIPWTFDLRTTENVPGPPGLTLYDGDDGPPERELAVPVLQLRFPNTWFELPDLPDRDQAVLFLADRIQDHVVEELHGAWPACPGHPHPARPERSPDGPVWRCPVDPARTLRIGSLTAAG